MMSRTNVQASLPSTRTSPVQLLPSFPAPSSPEGCGLRQKFLQRLKEGQLQT